MSLLSISNIVMTPVCGFAFSFLRQSSILVLVPFLMALMCLCHLYVGLAPLWVPLWPALLCIGSVYRCVASFRVSRCKQKEVDRRHIIYIYISSLPSLFGTAIWPSVPLVIDEAHAGCDCRAARRSSADFCACSTAYGILYALSNMLNSLLFVVVGNVIHHSPDYVCIVWATSAFVGLLSSAFWAYVMMRPFGGVYQCVTSVEPIEKFGEVATYTEELVPVDADADSAADATVQ